MRPPKETPLNYAKHCIFFFNQYLLKCDFYTAKYFFIEENDKGKVALELILKSTADANNYN